MCIQILAKLTHTHVKEKWFSFSPDSAVWPMPRQALAHLYRKARKTLALARSSWAQQRWSMFPGRFQGDERFTTDVHWESWATGR